MGPWLSPGKKKLPPRRQLGDDNSDIVFVRKGKVSPMPKIESLQMLADGNGKKRRSGRAT
jgi:hypothetical protein